MPHRSRRKSAFTLVELVIAVTITVLIVVMLGTIFGSLTNTSLRANQRIDAFRDARAALQMIQRDMTCLVHAVPTAYFALANQYNDPNSATQKNQQLYGLIATKNSGQGDLCAVGFYCRWDGKAYTLRRYFRSSNELMADDAYFTNQSPSRTTPPWNFRANGAGTYMPSSKLYQPSDTDAPTSSPPTFKDEVLAANVWNLQIKAFKANGSVDSTYPLIIDPSNPSITLPAAIEVSFYAMSSQAARTAMSVTSSPDDWMTPATPNFQRLIRPHVYEFRTRIEL